MDAVSSVDNIEDDLAKAIQVIFRSSPLVLVGSGFSCAYGLPGMAELGDYLCDRVGSQLESQDARALWSSALPAVRTNLELGLNTIASGAAGREEVVAALRERTAEMIIARTRDAEEVLLEAANPRLLAPARLIRRIFDGASQNSDSVPVITTNYDTLIELFCDFADVPVDTGFSGFRRRRARSNPIFQTLYTRNLVGGKRSAGYDHRPNRTVRLMKPHGSITWQSANGEPIEVLNDLSSAPRAIVVPGPSKYEDALVNNLFDSMRQEMNNAVSRASSLFCIGFGFNDVHLQGTIRSRLESGMPVLILTRTFTDSINDHVRRYRNIIAIEKCGEGAKAIFDGKNLVLESPVWDLDSFLTNYLE